MDFIRILIRGIAGTFVLFFLISSVRSSASAPVATDFIIYEGAADQVTPAVAFNPVQREYLAVWTNDRPGNDDIYARRLSAHGYQVGDWFSIAAGAGFERRNPDVAYNSAREEFLVVWDEEPQGGYVSIRGLRVSKFGALIPPVINISSGPALKNCWRPAVAYSSTSDNYLVVWETMVFGGLNSFIEAQVISSGGAPDGANFSLSAVSSPGTSDSNPDVAYNRSHNEYLAVFERVYQNLPQVDTDLYGRLVSPSGTPIGAAPESIYSDNVDQANPSVAAIPTTPGNGKYFVAWESLYAPGNINIYGRRFSRDLAADGLIRMLSNSLENESHPAVAADEHTDRFLIAWSQPWGGATNSQIYAQYFPQETEILGDSFPLGGNQSGLYSDEPAVSSGLPGDFLLAYRDTGMGKTDSDIFGQVLGIRRYIPLVIH